MVEAGANQPEDTMPKPWVSWMPTGDVILLAIGSALVTAPFEYTSKKNGKRSGRRKGGPSAGRIHRHDLSGRGGARRGS